MLKLIFKRSCQCAALLFAAGLIMMEAAAADTFSAPSSVALEPITTNTQKTDLLIDADVLMPDSMELFEWQVKPRAFSDREIQDIAVGFGFPAEQKAKVEHQDDAGSAFQGSSLDIYTFTGKQCVLRI